MGFTSSGEKFLLIKIRDDFIKLDQQSPMSQIYLKYILNLENKKNPYFLKYYGMYYQREFISYYLVFECPINLFKNFLETASVEERLMSVVTQFAVFYFLLQNGLTYPLFNRDDYYFINSNNNVRLLYLGQIIDENLNLVKLYYNDIMTDYQESLTNQLSYYFTKFGVNNYKEYVSNHELFHNFLTFESIKVIRSLLGNQNPSSSTLIEGLSKNMKIFFLEFLRKAQLTDTKIDLYKEYETFFTLSTNTVKEEEKIISLKITKLIKLDIVILSSDESDITNTDKKSKVDTQRNKKGPFTVNTNIFIQNNYFKNNRNDRRRVVKKKIFGKIVRPHENSSINGFINKTSFMDKYFIKEEEKKKNENWFINPREIPICNMVNDNPNPIRKIWDPNIVCNEDVNEWLNNIIKEWNLQGRVNEYYEDMILSFLYHCNNDYKQCEVYLTQRNALFSEFIKIKKMS
jgi:hypothetical protein